LRDGLIPETYTGNSRSQAKIVQFRQENLTGLLYKLMSQSKNLDLNFSSNDSKLIREESDIHWEEKSGAKRTIQINSSPRNIKEKGRSSSEQKHLLYRLGHQVSNGKRTLQSLINIPPFFFF
jgi:hypothetical protein